MINVPALIYQKMVIEGKRLHGLTRRIYGLYQKYQRKRGLLRSIRILQLLPLHVIIYIIARVAPQRKCVSTDVNYLPFQCDVNKNHLHCRWLFFSQRCVCVFLLLSTIGTCSKRSTKQWSVLDIKQGTASKKQVMTIEKLASNISLQRISVCYWYRNWATIPQW